jgi:hypothetical protein
MATQALKNEAMQAVCACYYYELVNEIDNMTSEDLHMIINKPFYCHYINGEDIPDCPEYKQEQAENTRDSLREDGIAV